MVVGDTLGARTMPMNARSAAEGLPAAQVVSEKPSMLGDHSFGTWTSLPV